MAATELDVRSWLLRLITWDGALPACMVFAPAGIKYLFPNNRGAIEIAAIVLPITAFWFRFVVGKRHIDTNHCGPLVQTLQLCVLCLAIFIFVFCDAVIALSHIMPQVDHAATGLDMAVFGIIGLVYLTLMAFAMYPGRSEASEDPYWQDLDPS
jgi:hypothetical protein